MLQNRRGGLMDFRLRMILWIPTLAWSRDQFRILRRSNLLFYASLYLLFENEWATIQIHQGGIEDPDLIRYAATCVKEPIAYPTTNVCDVYRKQQSRCKPILPREENHRRYA